MSSIHPTGNRLVICLHLGLLEDPSICNAYPSYGNQCYAESDGRQVGRTIPNDVQGELCLTQQHTQCPTYLRVTRSRADQSPPPGIRGYFDFFGFREEPFSIVPMPRYLYYTPRHTAVLRGLQFVVEARLGLAVLYGPMGVGKTVLCRTLQDRLNAHGDHTVAFLPSSAYRSEFAMLQGILSVFQVPTSARSQRDLEHCLLDYLVREVTKRGRTVALAIDEAQVLRPRMLELVRQLLNYQTTDTQLLQIILSGQMELVKRLDRVPALRDRAVAEYTLDPLTPADVAAMVEERLARAGRKAPLFTPAATRLIYERSQGYPRRIIVLCIRSLWLAYQERERRIDASLVQRAVDGLHADVPGELVLASAAPGQPGAGPGATGRSLRTWLRRLRFPRRLQGQPGDAVKTVP